MTQQLAIHGGPAIRRRPWAEWPEHGEPERRALERVLESRSWGGFPAPNTESRALADEFAAYVGATRAVPCANGTFSIMLALQAGRVSPGAEVVTSSYTFVGTAGGIVAAGCVPVFVDVDPDTLCLDPEAVEAAIGPRTEAVVPVHLASQMADMDRLPEICERRGLLLIEDCAHVHGARWRDRGAGSIGDFGSFSMQSSKLLTAGEGGAVSAREEVGAERVWSLVDCGRRPADAGFPEQLMGHNLRMTEWQAAVAREQLRRLPEQHERRASRLALFERALADVPGLQRLAPDPRITRPTAYQTILLYDAEAFACVPRDAVVEALHAEGVPCAGRFYVPLNEDPLFADDTATNPARRAGIDYAAQRFPVARRAAYEQTLWLPHELFLGDESDVADLVAALAKVQAQAATLRSSAS